jgi:hypothetical protein
VVFSEQVRFGSLEFPVMAVSTYTGGAVVHAHVEWQVLVGDGRHQLDILGPVCEDRKPQVKRSACQQISWEKHALVADVSIDQLHRAERTIVASTISGEDSVCVVDFAQVD